MSPGVAFGARLRELRVERGITQEELGRRTALSQKAVSGFERGLHEPRLGSIMRLARGLDVTPGVLLDSLVADHRSLARPITLRTLDK